MIKLHVISDLFLEYNEFCPAEDEVIPDVDLVILNGNIGHVKRGFLYAETLARKYPNIQFVYNLGERERYNDVTEKFLGEFEENLKVRVYANETWPKNLHWSTDSILLTFPNGESVDILCKYGFPKIHKLETDWENTVWFQEYVASYSSDLSYFPKESSQVYHDLAWVYASVEWINQKHLEEWMHVKKWEINPTYKKILVTHCNPFRDNRYLGQVVSAYNIHLENGIWIGSNQFHNGVKFLGSKLYSNPGRGLEARNRIIVID